MGSSIEDVARSWLADPAWQKVFKHTFDVIEDYVSYVLVALGAIALSVKLLTTLSTGDLGCYANAIQPKYKIWCHTYCPHYAMNDKAFQFQVVLYFLRFALLSG